MNKYLEVGRACPRRDQKPASCARASIAVAEIHPMLCGTAFKNKGRAARCSTP